MSGLSFMVFSFFVAAKIKKQYWNMDNFKEKNIEIWKILTEITIQTLISTTKSILKYGNLF